jgi:aminopeptidase N
MANVALRRAAGYADADRSFYHDAKRSAYFADRLPTTHPIEVPVPDTDAAFANFDDITYGKGASVLKQLAYHLGEEPFRRGVTRYLRDHRWGSTGLGDFLAALQAEAPGRDLEAWARDWLATPGFNALTAEVDCRDGRIRELRVRQEVASGAAGVLRTHSVLLGLHRDLASPAPLLDRLRVEVSGAVTRVPAATGMVCPELVYPNQDDWGYVAGRLADLRDPLLRAMLWHDLWQSVEDGTLPLGEFLDLALANLDREADPRVLELVLRAIDRAFASLDALRQAGSAPAGVLVDGVGPRLAALYWERLAASAAGSDLQKVWYDAWARFAEGDAALARRLELLRGERALPGLELDAERRWRLLIELARRGQPDVMDLAGEQARADPTAEGQRYRLAVDAARPSAAVKRRWIRTLARGDLPVSHMEYALDSLFPVGQAALLRRFAGELRALIPAVDREQPPEVRWRLVAGFAQGQCTPQSVAALDAVLAGPAALSEPTVRQVREAREMDARCVRMGERLAGGGSGG